MVGLDTQVLEALLHIDPHRTAATPESDDEGGSKTIIEDIHTQSKRVVYQFFFFDEQAFGQFS